MIQAGPLPPGWSGKLWAISEGLKHARSLAPDYLLFTDADIVHAPDNIAELVARAETENLDLVSLMVKLRCRSLAETLTDPGVRIFLLHALSAGLGGAARSQNSRGRRRLHPNSSKRPRSYRRDRARFVAKSSTIARWRAPSSAPAAGIWLGVTQDTRSVRDYTTFAEIRGMISRTAFAQLHHSALLLAGNHSRNGESSISPLRCCSSLTTPSRRSSDWPPGFLMTICVCTRAYDSMADRSRWRLCCRLIALVLHLGHHRLRDRLLDWPRRRVERSSTGCKIIRKKPRNYRAQPRNRIAFPPHLFVRRSNQAEVRRARSYQRVLGLSEEAPGRVRADATARTASIAPRPIACASASKVPSPWFIRTAFGITQRRRKFWSASSRNI